MKKLVLIGMCIFLAGMTLNLKSQNMTQDEKISYAIGASMGESFLTNGLKLNLKLFKKGFTDAFGGVNKLSQEEIQEAFNSLQQKVKAKQNQGAEIEKEKEKGRQFLAENKKRSVVKETPSGLQYEVLVMGKGPKPTATDRVKVHYTGKTLDGKVFDSSVNRGEPIDFALNEVIPGWTEGVQLMPVGSKFMLYIPSDLAYGDNGAGAIKPGATLTFEVELIEILK